MKVGACEIRQRRNKNLATFGESSSSHSDSGTESIIDESKVKAAVSP